MKRNILFLLSLCMLLITCSDSNDPIKEIEKPPVENKEPGVYYVEKMGTLGTMLNQTQKDTITTMIVKGEINKADFDVMRLEMPQLIYIDLKEVKCEDDKIPDYAFDRVITRSHNNLYFNTIILPESITTIGKSAFYGCSGLTGDLIFPDGLTTIEDGAFSDCYGFTGNLILPDGLTTIGDRAFWGCFGFTGDLILPDGLTTIRGGVILQGAFYGCYGFTGDLILPDGLTTIGGGAFWGCSGFTGLTIGKNLTTISSSAFEDCRNITGDVVFPASLTSIRGRAFKGCSKVEAFQFPHTTPLEYDKRWVYSDNSTLEKSVPVKVPNEAVSAYQSAYGWKEHTIIGY